jgi:hypothetical protein
VDTLEDARSRFLTSTVLGLQANGSIVTDSGANGAERRQAWLRIAREAVGAHAA